MADTNCWAFASIIALACTSAAPTPTVTVAATATASSTSTPLPAREWDLEDVQVDGSTVTVSLRVYVGIDVQATLDGRPADVARNDLPTLEYVFLNVAPAQHTVAVQDVVGHNETASVVVPADSIKKPNADGLCVPPALLGVSVGDTWTISGTVVITGPFRGEGIPQGATGQSTSFTVTAI